MAVSANEHRLYFRLQSAAAGLKKAADRTLLDKAGVSTAQAAVLNLIRQEKVTNQKYLAATLRQQESAVTTMVNRLLQAKLVARERSASDRRAWELRLTPNGTAALQAAGRAFRAINEQLDDAIGSNQVARLVRELEKIEAISTKD